MTIQKNTEPPQTDPIGKATMSGSMPDAHNYHQMLYRTLRPYLGSKVWEIGSGYGQYTRYMLDEQKFVLASDIDQGFLDKLRELQSHYPKMAKPNFIDLNQPDIIQNCMRWEPDSIVSINVLEHIKDHQLALSSIARAANRDTRITILVPAFQMLYGFMDEQAGHYRRYTRTSLSEALRESGWKVEKSFYLNPIGGLGWWIQNKLLAKPSSDLDDPEVNDRILFFDKYCVRPTEIIGKVCSPFFGQSVVAVASVSKNQTDR